MTRVRTIVAYYVCYLIRDSIAVTKNVKQTTYAPLAILTYVEHTAKRGNANTKLSRVKKIAMLLLSS